MIIDFHTHLAPPKWKETKPLPPSLVDIDGFFEKKEAAGITISVISNPMMNVPGSKQNDLTLEMVKGYNEFASNLMDAHKGTLYAMVGINPFDDGGMLDEMEQAIKHGGFKGVIVNSSVQNEYLGSERAEAFWERVSKLNVPVFVHPPADPLGTDVVNDFRLVEHVARPCDVTLSLVTIIFSGVLERYPQLKIIAGMAGGGLAMLPGRLDFGYAYRHWMTGDDNRGRPSGSAPFIPPGAKTAVDRISNPPSYYFKNIYLDSCTYHAPAMMCNIGTVGADHVLFGTDFPPVNLPVDASINLIRSLPIAEQEKEKILWRNAAELLKLDIGVMTR